MNQDDDKLATDLRLLGCELSSYVQQNSIVILEEAVQLTFSEHRKYSMFEFVFVSVEWLRLVTSQNELVDIKDFILNPLPTFSRDVVTIFSGFNSAFVCETVPRDELIRRNLSWHGVSLVDTEEEADIAIVNDVILGACCPKTRAVHCLVHYQLLYSIHFHFASFSP